MTISRPIVALVPTQGPGRGKTRLQEAGLDAEVRASLSAAMLADVAAALHAAPLDAVVVAAASAQAAAAGRALGLDVLLDPPSTRTLDEAVAAAAGKIREVGSLIVVMADLPRLRPEDVVKVLETDAPVVIAPTEDGGTGGLLRIPPNAIGTAYGPNSAMRHVQLAERSDVEAAVVHAPGFRHDVDTAADLLQLRQGYVGPATAHVLSGIDLDALDVTMDEAG